ncbi:hypothetical protein [Agrobacterium fabrum]|uniref:hypothetical protein n=1 Tax=Agrobacterium TaxID=357 RepID=UPI0009FBBF59|nr:IS66 family insertion sequence hypothetical protein [Agrobacterium sp. CGMCC 11546]
MQFVAACLEPGAIISEVARDAGVHVSQLFVGAKSSAGSRSRTSRRQHLGAGDRCLNRAGRPCCTTGTAPTSHSRRKRSDVTIELGRGRSIRVDSDIDTEALARILDCVMGLR